jgi:hypothetical protein
MKPMPDKPIFATGDLKALLDGLLEPGQGK